MSQVPRRIVYLHAARERSQDELREISMGYFSQGRESPKVKGPTHTHAYTHGTVHTYSTGTQEVE